MDRTATRPDARPAALWAGDANLERLVNNQGEVFEANLGDVEDESLPTLKGPEGSAAQMLALLRRLAPVLAPLLNTLMIAQMSSARMIRPMRLLNVEPMVSLLSEGMPL